VFGVLTIVYCVSYFAVPISTRCRHRGHLERRKQIYATESGLTFISDNGCVQSASARRSGSAADCRTRLSPVLYQQGTCVCLSVCLIVLKPLLISTWSIHRSN
jgi:hypothetical protein